jgi:hypothetical protein
MSTGSTGLAKWEKSGGSRLNQQRSPSKRPPAGSASAGTRPTQRARPAKSPRSVSALAGSSHCLHSNGCCSKAAFSRQSEN